MASRQTRFHGNAPLPGDNTRQISPGDNTRQGVDACGPTKPLPQTTKPLPQNPFLTGCMQGCMHGSIVCKWSRNCAGQMQIQLNDRNRTDHRYQDVQTHSGPGWPSTEGLQGLIHSSAPRACSQQLTSRSCRTHVVPTQSTFHSAARGRFVHCASKNSDCHKTSACKPTTRYQSQGASQHNKHTPPERGQRSLYALLHAEHVQGLQCQPHKLQDMVKLTLTPPQDFVGSLWAAC